MGKKKMNYFYEDNMKDIKAAAREFFKSQNLKMSDDTISGLVDAINEAAEEKAPANDYDSKYGKPSNLVFYKKYYTYQAFLEIHPKNGLSVDGCFAKAILYIMNWLRGRVEDERPDVYEKYEGVRFLKDDYPEVEKFADFDISKVENIYGLPFLDFVTAYLPDKKAWLATLSESSNNSSDLPGRVYISEFFLYKEESSVAFGIRHSCREPETNLEDAGARRNAFVSSMIDDEDFAITEKGIPISYEFNKKAIHINGNSGTECETLLNQLVDSEYRQMPIIFVPEAFYKDNPEGIDGLALSLMAYAYVLVCEGSAGKLFGKTMNNPVFVEKIHQNQIIYYRTSKNAVYPTTFFKVGEREADSDKKTDSSGDISESSYTRVNNEGKWLIKDIREMGKNEPCRKYFDFKDYFFKPSWWEISKQDEGETPEDYEKIVNSYKLQISKMEQDIELLNKDSSQLQARVTELESDKKELNKENTRINGLLNKAQTDLIDATTDLTSSNDELKETKDDLAETQKKLDGLMGSIKDIYEPLLNLPVLDNSHKEDILKWIEKYYSNEIIILPSAEKSFYKDGRPVDMRKVCMYMHYLAGYTRYRQAGGPALNKKAAREYDPENYGTTIEFSSSGEGAAKSDKEAYTMTYQGADGKTKSEIMDLHIKSGQGRDAGSIRVMLHYDDKLKKSVVGLLLGEHLPTASNPH